MLSGRCLFRAFCDFALFVVPTIVGQGAESGDVDGFLDVDDVSAELFEAVHADFKPFTVSNIGSPIVVSDHHIPRDKGHSIWFYDHPGNRVLTPFGANGGDAELFLIERISHAVPFQ